MDDKTNNIIPIKFNHSAIKKYFYNTFLNQNCNITDILYNAEQVKNTLLNRFDEIDTGSLKEILNKTEEYIKKYGPSILLDTCRAACCFELFKRQGNTDYLQDSFALVENLLSRTYLLNPGHYFNSLQPIYQKLLFLNEFDYMAKNLYRGNFFIYGGKGVLDIFLGNRPLPPCSAANFYLIPHSTITRDNEEKQLIIKAGNKILLSEKMSLVARERVLSLACVCSEKIIYSTKERPKLFFIFPGKPKMDFNFSVYSKILGTDIIEQNLTTDKWGTASFCFTDDLAAGQYAVKIKNYMHQPYSFVITEYSYNPLAIRILNYDSITEAINEKIENDLNSSIPLKSSLDFKEYTDLILSRKDEKEELIPYQLEVRLFNQPYEGELYCSFSNKYGYTQFSRIIDIKDGRGVFKAPPYFNTSFTMHYDYVQLTTPEGYQYQVELEPKHADLTRAHSVTCYSIKFSESKDPDFFGYKLRFINHDDSIIRKEENPDDNTIRFFLNINITCGYAYAINEKGEKYQELALSQMKANSLIELKGSSIYSVIIMGLLNADDNLFYEIKTYSVFPGPGISLQLPVKTEPGMEIPVVIRPAEKCKVLLSIVDSRIKKQNPDKQLILRLTRHLIWIDTHCTEYESYYTKMLGKINIFDFLNIDYQDGVVSFYHRMKHSVVRDDLVPFDSDSADSQEEEQQEIKTIETRRDFRDVLYFAAFEVEEEKKLTIKANDNITNWDVHATAIFPHTVNSCKKKLESAKQLYVELDIPQFISTGDDITATAFAVLPKGEKAELTINGPDIKLKRRVEKTGPVSFRLTSPGAIIAELRSDNFIDKQKCVIKKPGTISRYNALLKYFKAGETIKHPTILYKNEVYLGNDILENLLQYPFGCAEQTAAKLYGLMLAYKAIQSGFNDIPVDEVERLINQGIERLDEFFSDKKNLFSLWEGGIPSVAVTIKILTYFIPFLNTKFKNILKYIELCSKSLLNKKVKTNSLLPINPVFKASAKIDNISDAYNFYIASNNIEEKTQCVEYIIKNVHLDNGFACWQDKELWGGTAEATARALQILVKENKNEFIQEGLFYLSTKMKNGRLYSTSDTAAFFELLLALNNNTNPVIVDNQNKEIILSGREQVQNCIIKKGKILGIQYKQEEINLLDSDYDNLNFDLSLSKINIKTGDKLNLAIKIIEKVKCPIVSIFLPPVLCSLNHGIKIQRIDVPVKYNDISFELTGVAAGKGKIYILVYDMYDEDKRAVYSTDIKVQEQKHKKKFSTKQRHRLLNEKTGSSVDALSDI